MTLTNAKKKEWLPEKGIAKWTANKAADMWAGFGQKKSGWKVCSVHFLLKKSKAKEREPPMTVPNCF